jgi:hypothetical protein
MSNGFWGGVVATAGIVGAVAGVYVMFYGDTTISEKIGEFTSSGPLMIGENPSVDASFLEGDWCQIGNTFGDRIERDGRKLLISSFLFRRQNDIIEFRSKPAEMTMWVEGGDIHFHAPGYAGKKIIGSAKSDFVWFGRSAVRDCGKCRDATNAEGGYVVCS